MDRYILMVTNWYEIMGNLNMMGAKWIIDLRNII